MRRMRSEAPSRPSKLGSREVTGKPMMSTHLAPWRAVAPAEDHRALGFGKERRLTMLTEWSRCLAPPVHASGRRVHRGRSLPWVRSHRGASWAGSGRSLAPRHRQEKRTFQPRKANVPAPNAKAAPPKANGSPLETKAPLLEANAPNPKANASNLYANAAKPHTSAANP
jgi:hypothetical protein